MNIYELFMRVNGNVSKAAYTALTESIKRTQMPMSRMIAIAFEHEMMREKPFELDLSFPDDEYIEYAYVQEAGKILDFIMSLNSGMGLDHLYLCRREIGVPDRDTFLLAFRELVKKKLIEPYKPAKNFAAQPYPDDYRFWRAATEKPLKAIKKKATEYETYQILKKKFQSN